MSAPTHIDRTLLERIAGGDQEAFTHLVDKYWQLMYSYIVRLCGSAETAEEIIQDTFLKAWLKRDQLPGIQNIGGWLYNVAAGYAYDALRKQKSAEKRKGLYEKEIDATGQERFTTTEELLLQQQYEQLVTEAMQGLPAQQLKVVQLVKLEGMTRHQVAAEMGISTETVKSYLALGLQKIRAYCMVKMGTLGLLLHLWYNR